MDNTYKVTGILWFVLSLLLCNGSDIIIKVIDTNLPSFQVTFLRFFFSCITLLPFIIIKGTNSLKTSLLGIHCIRATTLTIATFFWIKGVSIVDLSAATIIGFSIPIFIWPTCKVLLKEKIELNQIIVVLLGFLAVLMVLQPTLTLFNLDCLLLLIAAALYGILDVINKKYVDKEPLIKMLFYSSFLGGVISFPLALSEWETVLLIDLLLLLILGSSANLILFCILKAYQRLNILFLAPFHYLELLPSIFVGKFLFNETLTILPIIGALVIIFLNLYLIYNSSFYNKSQ